MIETRSKITSGSKTTEQKKRLITTIEILEQVTDENILRKKKWHSYQKSSFIVKHIAVNFVSFKIIRSTYWLSSWRYGSQNLNVQTLAVRLKSKIITSFQHSSDSLLENDKVCESTTDVEEQFLDEYVTNEKCTIMYGIFTDVIFDMELVT